MTNREIANILREIALFLEMDEVAFKPRAYETAAHAIEVLDQPVWGLYKEGGLEALNRIEAVGESIAAKLEELLKTGKLQYYQEYKKKYPIDGLALNDIEGLGPKMIKRLYEDLKIRTVKDLETAAKAGKIRKLPGLGEKIEEKILKGVRFAKKNRRWILAFILPEIEEILRFLRAVKGVKRLEAAGSARRMKETIGDLDLVAVCADAEALMRAFVSMPSVQDVLAHGPSKSMIRLGSGLEVDIRVIPEESWGAALTYFTGSRPHTIALRNLALDLGYTLNEYGLFKDHETKPEKRKLIAGRSEEEVYEAMGLQFIPPEIRHNWGEIDLAKKEKIPKLIGYGDLKGDLQVQSNWSDGSHSIEEMAQAAYKFGLKYIVITDHTKSLGVAGGLDGAELLRQGKEIDALNKKFDGKFRILKGAEVNILKDGSLDIEDEVLKTLDVAGAAVHSQMDMPLEAMTERICKAIRNPHIDILFHPTGRRINRRLPYELDIDEVIRVAKETGTVLEIDAYPDRLDLKDRHVKKAIEAKVKLSIDSDAHHV
ncbi:MAG: DNA polymerase/3'-5' exonuclease PolX, partial [Parcubacteria group bacterium]|nr:DNA polymerase/3'-5' exonuclease PolX [Parcubacteria group bacterium]